MQDMIDVHNETLSEFSSRIEFVEAAEDPFANEKYAEKFDALLQDFEDFEVEVSTNMDRLKNETTT